MMEASRKKPRRIVLATFGSLGDLHPYMAVALELQARGHQAVIATSDMYRQKVEAEGIGFAAIRPDLPDLGDTTTLMRQIMDARMGPEYIVRKVMLPHLRASYDDLTAAVQGADLLVTHTLTYAAPLVAEKLGLPWAGVALQPMIFLSIYDPPVVAPAPWLTWFRPLGPRFFGPLLRVMKRSTRSWTAPVNDLRAEIGQPPSKANPLFEGQFSPTLNLALFSPVLAAPQPDWPPHTVLTGFPFYDRQDPTSGMPPELTAFLEAGPPPIVFTLGSTAVMEAGAFYEESAEAARRLGRRAVLLIGSDPRNRPPSPLPEGVAAFEYAPFSELFPRAAAIVHSGGIGTTGQALRAGRPMLVMPFATDQPDNAARVARLGVARTISRTRYTAARAASELQRLLSDPRYTARAEEVGRRVRTENGAQAACDALQSLLRAEE